MKIVFGLLAILGLTVASPRHHLAPRILTDDLSDFARAFPFDQINDIVSNLGKTDGAFVNAILYLQGDEWSHLVAETQDRIAVQNILQHLKNSEFPVDDFLHLLHDFLTDIKPEIEPADEGSLVSFVDAVKAIFPFQQYQDMWYEKLANRPEFRWFSLELSSITAKNLLDEMRRTPEVKQMFEIFRG